MENINTIYNCKLEVLTPVHIGAGKEKDWVQGIDYIIDKERIKVFNQEKLYAELIDIQENNNQTGLDILSNYLTQRKYEDLEKYIKTKIDIKKVTLADYDILGEIKPAGEIKSFIRNGLGKQYIPGSSLKGAIRSILFNHLYKGLKPNGMMQKLENDLFGFIDNNIMKFIRVYDAECEQEDFEIFNIELFNLYNRGTWKSDYKKGFKISVEALNEKSEANLRINIASGLIDFIKNKGAMLPRNLTHVIKDKAPLENIFSIINQYSKLYIEKEIQFFESFPHAESTDLAIEELTKIVNTISKLEKSCILRMSYGSGFHGITGDWRLHDHIVSIDNPDNENWVWNSAQHKKAPAFYKSRRMIRDFDEPLPMGFVKLTIN